MNKFRLFAGWAVVLVIVVGWNLFHPGVTEEVDWRGATQHPANPLHISGLVFFLLMLAWYLLSWVNIINEWERRPVMFFGKYHKTAGPGLALVEPLLFSTLEDVPVQDVVIEVTAEDVQTKDNVSVGLVGVLTYRIGTENVKKAVVEVGSVADAILQRALSTLVDAGGRNDLDGLLEHRKEYCKQIEKLLAERVERWGVEVVAFELKGLAINDEHVEQAIAMKARAEKEGAAELARAHYQKRVAEALNEAAGAFTPAGWRLKTLEVLVEMTRSAANNTVLIPTELGELLGRVLPTGKVE